MGNKEIFDFTGRVVVITGAGRGIGRAYALLLASRGAKVVVNDLGGTSDGHGSDVTPAQEVVKEIIAAGGHAVANANDVSTTEGAEQIINTAIEHFGKIDVLINNAGIQRWAGLPEIEASDLQTLLNVHLLGSFNTIKAAWPHFVSQGYGRILMTTSTSVFGMARGLSYTTAKGGIIGLSRSVALAGEPHGIKVNLIAPAALTRIAGDEQPDSAGGDALMSPEAVAPMAGYLTHEKCNVNGEIFVAGAGRFSRMFIASTPGWVKDDGIASIEEISANWDAITNELDYYVSNSLDDWMVSFMSHAQ